MGRIRWSEFVNHPSRKKYLLRLGIAMLLMFIAVFVTLGYTETRHGQIIEQWLGQYYGEPVNFSIPVFALTYLTVAFAIATTVRKPVALLQLLTAYTIMQLIRVITLLLVPLDPPADIIPLSDPFLEMTFYNGRANLKDLFFSGHVATVCIIALYTPTKIIKAILWLIAMSIGIMLIQQRVHYVADVVAAPLFAWISVRLSRLSSRSIA